MASLEDKESLSEYEKRRLTNIEENEIMMKKLFPVCRGVVEQVNQTKPISSPKRRRKPRSSRFLTPTRSNPPRSAKKSIFAKESLHSDEGLADEDDEDLDRCGTAQLIVKIPFFKRRKFSTSSDEDDNKKHKKKRQRHFAVRAEKRDVREEDLVLVATRVAEKRYDSVNGTTCHQCRQKTDDLKTQCNGEECVGVRGQFCGPCLKNRYGEDAKQVLMDPQWVCPPCRGICNCSFCMKKRGRKCTGILVHFAHEHGYKSVKDLLDLD